MTAPSAATDQGSRNLLMRVIAAVILAPLTIAIAYAGGWPWAILVMLAAIGLYVEWLMIVGASRNVMAVAIGVVALVVSGFCLTAGRIDIAAAVVAISVLAGVITGLRTSLSAWISGGLVYAGLAMLASVLVRSDPASGFLALVFVLLIVWVTDIGGYFAGRGLGGPKLWPRVSPKKTWAGAIGGLVGSLVVASAFAVAGFGKLVPLLGLAVLLSIVSQLGDLFESAVKRNFGVKDSSHIIPGHGGLLDRLDGFVAAIIVAALFGVMRGGIDGIGRGLMIW
ncbi:phosphatidate cytidylyltransferase [Bradyrhizobium prioriisuperbiae]|uniref:phosphatidate cytidylyltransferase n=1 Tax=Bradyrhizobium prioriisuperbiae TaxID=2854389 RepID=UPI0028E9F39C|nr:phosphatidate cytidylyltransferase [Bradyrhizobium prioritasuperba]